MRKMSVRTNKSLKTIEAVIEYQLQGANDALKTANSIELSGFGKFLYNKKKAQKKLDKQYMKVAYWESQLLMPDITEAKRNSYSVKLENTYKVIESIKPKLHGDCTISGGLEEQTTTTEGLERDDRESLEGENGDLQGMQV